VVIVKREPAGATEQNEWCEFEERPGPAPLGAQEDDCTTHLSVADVLRMGRRRVAAPNQHPPG
jgi:hypothetical protein